MIRRISLKSDQLQVVDIAVLDDFPAGRSLSWVRVVSPTDEEVKLLASFLSLDAQDEEDVSFFLQEGGRSRVEKGEALVIVYGVPVIVEGDVETEEIMIFAKRDVVITLEAKKSTACEQFFAKAEKNKGRYLFKRNAGFFITELLDEITTRFLRHVNRIEERLDIIESSGGLLNREQVEAVAAANSTLSFFNQSTLANIEVLNSLRKMHHESVSAANREEFQDIYYDTLQIIDALKLQREAIMNLFNMQSIIAANQMNAFMKRITTLALIITVPTLISSIYGMNVAGLPFAHSPWAFWIVLLLMIVITGGLVALFFRFDRS